MIWLLLLLLLAGGAVAILGGVNPTTGQFSVDRSYLDQPVTPAFEAPILGVVGIFLLCAAAVFMLSKYSESQGEGGTYNNIVTIGLLAGVVIAFAVGLGLV